MSTTRTIGVIGLGLLGHALCRRLLAAGFTVIGFDINPAARRALERRGGTVADSAADVANRAKRILLSLPTTKIVTSVLSQLPLRRGATIIDTTTGEPAESKALAVRLARKGIHYLDATIVGSSADAAKGNVIVLAGAHQRTLESSRDVLTTFARDILHVGPPGAGMAMKLVVNLVLGLNRAVLAEGIAFAKATRISPRLALQALKAGAAYSRVMDTKGEKMLTGDFRPQARLAQHLKDVRMIAALGRTRGAKLPLTSVHRRLLARLVKAGFGALDNSAIIRAFEGDRM